MRTGQVVLGCAIIFWAWSEMTVHEKLNISNVPPALLKIMVFVDRLNETELLLAVNQLSMEEQRWLDAEIREAFPTLDEIDARRLHKQDAKKGFGAFLRGARKLTKLIAIHEALASYLNVDNVAFKLEYYGNKTEQ